MALLDLTLDDKYALETGRVFISATQALVRLPLMQRRRDVGAGLNTAGFISGYRGSPLGRYDHALWRAEGFLKRHHIHFQPGVNEELAATAAWGSQQVNLFPGARYDGVFALWYGKGPGVDRSGDAFKHGNAAGSSIHGGVLAIAGDDAGGRSSTIVHQSEPAFAAATMPILYPSDVQEVLDYGLLGIALSRYSGCWVGFKLHADVAESTASVIVDPARAAPLTPADFEMPMGGLNIRWPDSRHDAEERLLHFKLDAAKAFVRANGLDRVVLDSPNARLGIVTVGKTYTDVRRALAILGIDDALAAEIGLGLYKVAAPSPLEGDGLRDFARGLAEVLVIEEKRPLLEPQVKDHLYALAPMERPRVIGKFDEDGRRELPTAGERTPSTIAAVIGRHIARLGAYRPVTEGLARIEKQARGRVTAAPSSVRTAYFCPGCPHNRSTRVPEGSIAISGIGCHTMASHMADRATITLTQMGGEGMTWTGQYPFTEREHLFQNIGDGTYYHSGSLAIRGAILSGANVTFKVLYNDAVALTGGQAVEGGFEVADISRQLRAEGAGRIAVVTDEPDKYPRDTDFATGVTIHHRDDMDAVQRDLRQCPGVSVLIYDQACAAEKRRRRRRGEMEDPARRVFINDAVCEGCGDCAEVSSCMSVVPLETEFGRKRAIDQSSCNKDYSCVNGFCPSFVTVNGGEVRKPALGATLAEFATDLPAPSRPSCDRPYAILIAGVGGTGTVTLGALLGMAAHLEGKGCGILDETGLAQKGGQVTTHVHIAESPNAIATPRVDAGGADLLLGCDMVVSASPAVLATVSQGATRAIVNSTVIPTSTLNFDPDASFDEIELLGAVQKAAGGAKTVTVDATALARALLGDTIAANIFLLGFACQLGAIPVTCEAITRAIELNDVEVALNKQAFTWGRLAADAPDRVAEAARPAMLAPKVVDFPKTLDEIVARRVAYLTDYQNATYARRYADFITEVAETEAAKAGGGLPSVQLREAGGELAKAVAGSLFKLMAYKDEYEVARLFTSGDFRTKIGQRFAGDFTLTFHLAPPLIARRDKHTGHLKKRAFGPWVMKLYGPLARLKFLRGAAFDPFGQTAERKMERRLIGEYRETVGELLATLTPDNHLAAVEIAGLAEKIRGFGHVKRRNADLVEARQTALIAAYRAGQPAAEAAE
jgi:indolepyruvate ferredoxin oxidoreductase